MKTPEATMLVTKGDQRQYRMIAFQDATTLEDICWWVRMADGVKENFETLSKDFVFQAPSGNEPRSFFFIVRKSEGGQGKTVEEMLAEVRADHHRPELVHFFVNGSEIVPYAEKVNSRSR